MLAILGECLATIFGGAALAAIAAWIGWHLFRRLRWPEAGPWAIAAALVLVPGAMHRPLLQMTVFFLALFATGLIPAGHAWRKREKLRRLFHLHNIKVRRLGIGERRPPRHLV